MVNSEKLITPEFMAWFQGQARGCARNRGWFVDVDDLIQDAATRLHLYISNGKYEHRSDKKFRSLAMTTLCNLAKNALKKEGRINSRTVHPDGWTGADDDNRGFDLAEDDDDVIRRELREEIRPYLARLSPRRRRVIELRLQNHRTRDIVAILRAEGEPDISPQAVSKLVFEAKREIQGMVARDNRR